MKYLEFMYFNIISMLMGGAVFMLTGVIGLFILGIALMIVAICSKDKEAAEDYNGRKKTN